MNFINYIPFVKRYESCIGLSFPAYGKRKFEIWYAPAGYMIRPHTHPDVDIELVFLIGHGSTFYRERDRIVASETMKWWKPFRKMTVLRNDVHWFSVSRWPLVFFNIESWHTKPTSAAESFKLA